MKKINFEKIKEAMQNIAATEKGILWKDEQQKNHLLKISIEEWQDAEEDPRNWDNLTTMIFWSRSYSLGDKHNFADPLEFIQDLAKKNNINLDSLTDEQKESFSYIKDLLNEKIFLWPCWIYDHSGLAISCGARDYPFNDAWDSGLLGYIYTDKKTIVDNFGNCEDWKKKAAEIFKQEIKAYNQYINGEIYCFTEYLQETEKDDFEEVDSCGGFYDPSDVADYIETIEAAAKNFEIVDFDIKTITTTIINYKKEA